MTKKNEMMTENSRPLISIIMAAYNAEKTILAAIKSVQEQTYSDWELLVINDCSTDSTAKIVTELLESDPRIHFINNTVNCGVSLTRKRGLDEAQGEWIAVLDSDDMWMPDKLEKQIKLADQTDARFVFTGSSFIQEDGTPINWQLHVPEVITYRELPKNNLISNSSVLVKKELYQKFYALGDRMHEDYAIWLKITKSGVIAYGIDEPLLLYRLVSSSKTRNKFKSAIMNWRTLRYCNFSVFSSLYYMIWYCCKGLIKYRAIGLAKQNEK